MKRIVITGANKGIGLALVSTLLRDDPETFIFLGSRDQGRGKAAIDGLLAAHPDWSSRLDLLLIDVTSAASCQAAAGQIAQRFPTMARPLYGLVNNAGVGLSDQSIAETCDVNTLGIWRVCDALIPLLDPRGGRVVNITSAAGPMFVSSCSETRRDMLTDPDVTRKQIQGLIDEAVSIGAGDGDFTARGLGSGGAYGISKACANAATLELSRTHPQLVINACTPGYIETDMTRPHAIVRGKTPAEMGMKPPAAGTHSAAFLLLGKPGASGQYYGSDAVRSPLDRYRSPGDPPYTGN